MFQSFVDELTTSDNSHRIAQFRKQLEKEKLDGFYLQRADEHLSEDIPQCAERLAWLTDFTGSTGRAVILLNKAAMFVDGRYTLQAKDQLDGNTFETFFILDTRPADWITEHCNKRSKIGFDPKLHSIIEIEELTKKLKPKGVSLVPVEHNPIDEIWEDQPAPPVASVSVHPIKYAGVKPEDKIEALQLRMKEEQVDHAIITMPDSIAWLLNIRGKDVPRTPLALSFAILHAKKKPELFINPDKLTSSSRKHIEKYAKINPEGHLNERLEALNKTKEKILLDPATAPYWFLQKLDSETVEIVRKEDPCVLPKALKNQKEIEGARTAHERDGIAMCRFLSWLEKHAAEGELDEISAAKQLEQFRRETKALKDISFDTISGAGPNGAVIHYRVTERTNRKLKQGSLYLVDSGGQYAEGTTDITRTIAIGQPTKEMRTRFTQVLKGMISLTCARFPTGTMGASLDMLARETLWKAGVDYAHGTGHGVGSYLGVHEKPISISRIATCEVEPGMIISNEPGYYKENKYGIRIENLILATEPTPIKSGEIDMMGFETLTLAPIDRNLIDVNLLTKEELSWLNRYHARVRKTISPHLGKDDKSWLSQATAVLNISS